MALTNIAAVADALKSFYLEGLRYQLNSAADPLLAQIERDSESVVGTEIVMALRYGRSGGVGNRADDGDLPTPNSRKTKQAKWQTKNLFARIQLTDKIIEASKSSRGAFANLLEQDLEDALTDAKDNLSRQVYGDGKGVLASCTDAVNVATITVDTVQYLAEGMLVDIASSTGVAITNGTGREITAVDEVAKTFTVSGTADLSPSSSKVYVSGNYNLELTGLAAIFTTNNTIYGIDRSANKWFNPGSQAINGEISEVAIQQAIDDAERKAGGNINYLACSYGVRRAYQNLLTAQKQIINSIDLKGGWKALSYTGGKGQIPIMAGKYAPVQKLRALDLSNWKMYEMNDWTWLDRDGAVLSRVSGKAAWEATLAKYCDLGCDKPKGQVDLTGITEH